MIVWLASYPKSGNTLVRSLLASYFFSEDGNYDFEQLKNINQFPDTNSDEKKLIEDDIQEIEKKFNQKVVTYVRKFEIFYKAEEHHQDYYKEKFLNYLLYKEGCGRQRKLDNIWQ